MDSSGLPSLLVEAARTAAQEDGVAPQDVAPKDDATKKNDDGETAEKADKDEDADDDSVRAVATEAPTKKRSHEDPKEESTGAPPLRRGKWTAEEEAYASRLIVEFRAGLLPLTDGTTLRTFLSKLLNCDPMRISKKFVGSNSIGKQVFRRRSADVSNLTPEQIQRTRRELSELEKRFLDRVTKGGSSKGDTKAERAEKKMKLSEDPGEAMAGGLGMGMAPNRSAAAAAGHALLGGGNSGVADAGNAGLLAQLQASQPGMFYANDTNLFNSVTAAGLTIPGMGASAFGNGSALDINALSMQTGMAPEQITQLAQNKGYSSASLAQMLGKKRSFDRLMSLDFQSMQSIDNLANLLQRGMPNQAPMGGQMKNWDWNSGAAGGQAAQNQFGNLSSSMLSLNGPQNNMGPPPNQVQANAPFGMLGGYNQNSLLQNLQSSQQQVNNLQSQQQNQLNLLQGMGGMGSGGNSFETLLQSVQNGNSNVGNNTFTGLMGLGNFPQQNLMGLGLNNPMTANPFGGLQAGNPIIAALAAQQQMLNQNMMDNTGGLLSQQNQLAGLGGMGGLAGMNLSDPNTAALVQQLLAQQGGGGGQFPSGLGGQVISNQQAPTPQVTAALPVSTPQANDGGQSANGDAGQTVDV